MHKMIEKPKTPHSNKCKNEKIYLWCREKLGKSMGIDGESEEM